MDYEKIEDSVLKSAMDFFQQNAVNFFGINTKIIAPAQTELKDIKINTNFMDYTFYTEDGDEKYNYLKDKIDNNEELTNEEVKFKEVFNITEIGKMILEDGIAKGMEQGRKEGKHSLY
ncbi:hypothetical protein [Clostridium sp.]|uniref:hypothetical protein n=1 Tax=Clostridium sp. TaxID=1506 RepID=UPI003D6CAF07